RLGRRRRQQHHRGVRAPSAAQARRRPDPHGARCRLRDRSPAPMTSLRRRLLATLLGAFGEVWLVAVLITYLNVRNQVEERFDDELARTSQVLWLLFASSDTSGAGTARTEQDAYARRVLQRFGVNHAFQVWYGTELIARSSNAPE